MNETPTRAAAVASVTVSTRLAEASAQLTAVPGGKREAEALLAHLLGWTRTHLIAHSDHTLSAAQLTAFSALLARRAAGEPFAYLTGQREFWSLSLQVSPAVLIPRPETELVVERALALRDNAPAQVADLGTGSGAIALACAVERPAWRITATDASAEALAIAMANAGVIGCRNVQFLRGSWYQPLQGRQFDLILSNPPYVAADDPALSAHGLPFEPRSALVSGHDGLDDLRCIIADARAHLLPGGTLVLEHGAGQGPTVARLLVEAGFTHVRCHADLAGLPRVTEAL
jgi:release factor glutamine methyltransferase